MPNSHIASFLDHYIDVLEDPRYAVLLKGNWGSGKTWFIKKYMSEKVFLSRTDEAGKPLPRGRFVHVSLFGKESAADIDAAIFQALHPVLGAKESALIAKLLKTAIPNKTLSGMVKEIEKKQSQTTRPVEESFFNILRNTNKNIMVFDDVERCSMKGPELFGYINYFVEVLGFKVILLAHEKELLVTFPVFQQVKEKLVGKTFEVLSEFQPALDAFLQGIFSPNAQSFLQKSRRIIETIYFQSNANNLRILKQALNEFARLYHLLDVEVTQEKELTSRLLEIFLILSIEILPGNLLVSEIQDFFGSRLFFGDEKLSPEANTKGEKMHKMLTKYASVDFHEICLEIPIWFNLFEIGSLTKNQLNAELKKSRFFDRQNKSPLEKLYNYPSYSDEEAAILVEQALDGLHQKRYTTLEQLAHEAGTLFVLLRNGLLPPTHSVDVLMDIMGTKADQIFDAMSLDKVQNIFFGTDPEHVAMNQFFLDGENPDYNRFIASLYQKHEVSLIRKMEQKGSAIFSDNPAESFNILSFITTPSRITKDTPFLSNLGQELFVREVVNLKGFPQTRLAQYIGKRIEMLAGHPENPILAQETNFLKEALQELTTTAEQNQGKVSGVVLKKFITIIEHSLRKADSAIQAHHLQMHPTDASQSPESEQTADPEVV